MSLHLHHLHGCAATPLALYLKAIGILRLISEQSDPNARGWWQDEHFCLMTRLDRTELEEFFLEKYSPSAVFNPWGGRSGFYCGGNERTARMALSSVEDSDIPRLSGFRDAIATVRAAIAVVGDTKPETKEAKSQLVGAIRRQLRGPGAEWLATVLADLGAEPFGPPLFGTGGNEGSGSYTAAFFAAVRECLVQRSWDDALTDSLFSANQSGTRSWDGSFFAPNPENKTKQKKETVKGPFRQFLPEGDLSPWDLIVMFEGACVFRSGISKRSSGGASNLFVSSPFYFAPHGVGGLTSCDSDEFVINKGRRNPGRGEQWFPLWKTPTTYHEVQSLLSEGRCSIGRRRAKKPIDGARAIARLGVSRGISEFIRYGYLQRNNLATHFAVPLGRLHVRQHPRAHLIEDIATWTERLQREGRGKNAPARLVHAERRLATAVFAALTHDDTPQHWQAILTAAVDIESLQAGGTAIKAGPIPTLQTGWINAIHDNTPEVRLALAIGSAAAGFTKDRHPFDPIRHHWLPLERGARRFRVHDGRLANDPRVVMTGRDCITDCAEIVSRRLIEGQAKSRRILPLQSAAGCSARLADLAMLIDGHVDLSRVLRLGRALMALDWNHWNADLLPSAPWSNEHPDETWLALRLACLPWPIEKGLSIPTEPSLVNRLLSDDSAEAVRIAVHRLGASGLRTPFQSAFTDFETARLWAAALAFPISRYSARHAVKILVPEFLGDYHV